MSLDVEMVELVEVSVELGRATMSGDQRGWDHISPHYGDFFISG